MCVTAEPAEIHGTRTFVYATDLGDGPVHVCGYQNQARTLAGGNCMFLNFAGTDLNLVRGPERTRNFMQDMTTGLPELVPVVRTRSRSLSYRGSGVTVEDYGDYTVILAQGPDDILSALSQVPAHRRPVESPRLHAMVNFYMSWYPQDSFVLACFDGLAKPQHPITVSYRPRNRDVLIVPGLDGHDGNVPTVGAPVYRNFRVAFAIQGLELPIDVSYLDGVVGRPWAPISVTGFVDNRRDGRNGDYVIPIGVVRKGLSGAKLAKKLLAPR
jgi:hypothetical protein